MSENPNATGSLCEILLANLLSFGPDTPSLSLERLNVLIGPNGTGKSNLIEALTLMRATPVPPQTTSNADVRGVIRRGGGTGEWIWKGAKGKPAILELVVGNPKGPQSLRHRFSFRDDERGFRLDDERIENDKPYRNEQGAYFFYRFQNGHPVVNTVVQPDTVTALALHETPEKRPITYSQARRERRLARESVNSDASILAQRRDPELYPEITHLADTYEKWRIYREWAFGRNTVFREPQKADMRNDRLEEDFSNLGLFLSRLRKSPKAKRAIMEGLRDLYDGLTDFEPVVEGGSVQIFFTEADYSIPATRLSDGTLRYLCLLAILCDPEPPPLICIEEPELGLHPDILPKVADLLKSASERTQLIITTHSDILVDAMTETPEYVVVCEKHEGQTMTAHLGGKAEFISMWLDSEEPVERIGETWAHLKRRDNWNVPENANDEQVLFMTTCMETWIVADHPVLREHFGHKLQSSALPPLVDLEGRDRHIIQDSLAHATRECKNACEKGKRSFDVFSKLTPATLEEYLPSFARIRTILDSKL